MFTHNYSRHRVQRAIIVGVCYFLAAAAATSMSRIGGGFALVWPASAILLAELSVISRRAWPLTIGCAFVASMVATGLLGLGPWAMIPVASVNMVETVIAALIIGKLGDRTNSFESPRGICVFILAAAIVAPMVSATLGSFIVFAMGQEYWINWFRWTTGHALGALIVTPVALMILSGEAAQWMRQSTRWRIAEAAAILSAVAIVSGVVFSHHYLLLLFAPILPMMIATFRAGRFGASTSIVMLAVIGGYYSLGESGPIAMIDGTQELQLAFFQVYLAIMVLTVLPIAADLKRREILHAKLADSEARYRLLTERSSDIIMNSDRDGMITFVSPSITTLGGYREADVLGRNVIELVHPDHVHALLEVQGRILTEPDRTHIVEYLAVTNSGEELWFESHIQAVQDAAGRVVGTVSSIRDISHRKSREDELTKEAETDGLTGLLNRRGFMRELDGFIERSRSGAPGGCLAMFDLDHFKAINDEYGHAAGDIALVEFSRVARGIIRDGDLVSRVGGEEFALLLRGASRQQALAVCERVRVAVARLSVNIDTSLDIRMTVSAGVAALEPLMGRAELLQQADEALYAAKAGGRNQLMLAA